MKVTIYSIWTKRSAVEPVIPYTVDVPQTSVPSALSGAYALTNMDNRPYGNRVCSTSCGDIMQIGAEFYLVDKFGFTSLTTDEANKIIDNLTSRDTSFGYAWMKKNNII